MSSRFESPRAVFAETRVLYGQIKARTVSAILTCVAALTMLGGCAATRPGADWGVSLQSQYQRLIDRVALRSDSTRTASYRIRWRARQIEPHAEMILRIDYKAPDQFHIAGKGPMDIPAFTAWVTGSDYVLLEHRGGDIRTGRLGDISFDEFLVDARPFGAFLGLFAGGCGVSLPDSFDTYDPGFLKTERKDFVWTDGESHTIFLDLQKGRLKRIEWMNKDPRVRWNLWVRLGRFSDRYPFWELRSARWENKGGPGEYRWEVLAQKYNPDLPDQLFTPPTK